MLALRKCEHCRDKVVNIISVTVSQDGLTDTIGMCRACADEYKVKPFIISKLYKKAFRASHAKQKLAQ